MKSVCQGEVIASLARCVSGGNATGKVCVRGECHWQGVRQGEGIGFRSVCAKGFVGNT
ncbi:hypothetical protein [Providencia sp. PROV018]|uniref:hypothetical protein n=1 Tax=Providencia sp. PROV018 TaxID=2949753 RepID=UPI00234B4200|nr:hypothetical protein [Providencia sp. PROV018]